MTTWEQAVGKTALLRVDGSKDDQIQVPVLILGIKLAFGRVFARVSPHGGVGNAQVSVSRLEWSGDWQPPLQPYEQTRTATS